MQLTSFSVTGFRSLADVQDIPLQRPTILTGRNDSGKSSMLDALAFLLEPSQKVRATDFPDGTAENKTLSVTGTFELTDADREATGLPATVQIRRTASLESDAVAIGPYEVEREVPEDPRLRDLESRSLNDLRTIADALNVQAAGNRNAKESFLLVLRPLAEGASKCLDWASADYLLDRFPAFLYRTGVGAADVSDAARLALKFVYQEILKQDRFRDTVAQLQAGIADALSEAAQSLCKIIEQNCDGLSDVSLVPEVSFREASLLGTQVFAHRDGRKVSFEQAGTGRRQQVIHAIWEWQNLEIMRSESADRAVVIAYDEPDVSLDYARQRNFMNVVREQCETGNVRAVVATHSVQMIDQVPLEDVVHLELAGGTTHLRRVPSVEHDDISTFIGQLTEELGLSTSSVLFERCFLLVEGKTEKQAFPRFFYLATGHRLQEAGIVIVDAEGNTAVPKLVKCLREMGKPVYVIVDADSKRDHPNLFNRDKLLEYGVLPGFIDYLGEANELEELFPNERWSDLANEFCPRGEGPSWEVGHFSSLRGPGKKFSDEVKNLLGQSKPDLMTQMARKMSHRDHLPKQLTAAFDRLMETLRNSQHN